MPPMLPIPPLLLAARRCWFLDRKERLGDVEDEAAVETARMPCVEKVPREPSGKERVWMSIEETAVVALGLACSWADSSRRGEPSGLEGLRGGSGGGGDGDCEEASVGCVFGDASPAVSMTGGAAAATASPLLGSAMVIYQLRLQLQSRAVIAPPKKAAM